MAKPSNTALPRPRWKLIPLGLLLALVVASGCVGFVAQQRLQEPRTTQLPTADAERAACIPDRAPALAPEQQPWLDDRAQDSEAQWQSHSAAIANYAKGPNGWLFLGDIYVDNLSQATGRSTLNEAEVTAFRQRYVSLQRSVEQTGAAFAFMVAPAKWDVYPQELPEWMQPLRGATTVDILESAVPELHWIDPRDALVSAPERTYSPVNSHWTDYGGYLAWDYAAGCLAERNDRFSEIQVPQLKAVTHEADESHNEFGVYGEGVSSDTWTGVTLARTLPSYQLTAADGTESTVPGDHEVGLQDLPVALHNEKATLDASALVVGDSTFSALTPYFASTFRDVRAVRHQLGEGPFPDVAALTREYDADLVIMIVTERNLQLSLQ